MMSPKLKAQISAMLSAEEKGQLSAVVLGFVCQDQVSFAAEGNESGRELLSELFDEHTSMGGALEEVSCDFAPGPRTT